MQQPQPQTFVFKDFKLDLSRGFLLHGQQQIKLRPKSFETLKHLVENSGRLISKNELIGAVWPDTSVTDDSLVQCLIEVRRALGEEGPRILKTVPRRGYIFDVEVTPDDVAPQPSVQPGGLNPDDQHTPLATTPWVRRHAWLVATVSIIIVVTGSVFLLVRRKQPQTSLPEIRTLAVLPFKSQIPQSEDDYLGLGIANEIITKVSQTGALTVRPTSAIRKYTNQEVDALQVARELKVDAVLDGTYLRVGNQLRITVNLLRVTDGSSLWADKFDQQFTDIFVIQDRVSQQVAQSLWRTLSPTEQARLTKRYTSNPIAYSYYAKAMYHFYNIGPTLSTRSDATLAVDLFRKAIELDPEYALAHAQLGYAYTRIAVFQEDNPALIDLARQELATAERIDPQLAEVHLARYFIAFSQYEGWSVDKAIKELRLAQKLDPQVGHAELVDLYSHIGLEEETTTEFERALEVDPNNEELKNNYLNALFISARPDEGLKASKQLLNREPGLRYFVEKRMMHEAEPLAKQEYQRDPDAVWKFVIQILLKSLQGKHREAQSAIPAILAKERRYRGYHHDTYNIARIYALAGNHTEALKWLRTTVTEGFSHYPLFVRDPFLDPIREDAGFKQFLSEIKTRWEGYKREFG